MAVAFHQRDLARLVNVHLQVVVPPGRRPVRGGRPVGARRVPSLPFRERGRPHGRRPTVVVVAVVTVTVGLPEAAAPEVPQLDAELAFELLL